MLIGHGFDVHRFIAGDGLVLGGVHVPCDRSIEAHSDGDVLVHAICDALLGALGEGDIGRWFPDSDPRYAGMDSREMLRAIMSRVSQQGLALANADSTLIAQRPRLAPHIGAMRENLAVDMGVSPQRVNVKATTTERLGYLGREEGIAAHAVVLLVGDAAAAIREDDF